MNQEQWNLLLIALAQRVYQLEQRIKTMETAHNGCKTDCSGTRQIKASSKRRMAGVLPSS
jgi:hypothetical protein